ncbi:MAG: flagellar basal body L-ring protein FlgH [Rubrivivax sp.]|nr:MAG: flagellar basal body L-ring protein FlgH [Rubrivivax sp.]
MVHNTLSSIALRTAGVAAIGLLLAGCETLSRTPQVELYKPAVQATAIAPQQYASAQGAQGATGSLFRQTSFRPAFEDRRARYVGDIVTITIVENVSASQTKSSTVDKSSSTTASATALPFMGTGFLGKLDASAGSSNTFEGKGGTTSANTFTGSITTTVVDVLPNGHLIVTGEKQIGVNENVDTLRFSGTVDPRSIGAGSVVPSTQVANVRVESRGRGAQSESQIMPFLARFLPKTDHQPLSAQTRQIVRSQPSWPASRASSPSSR